MLTLMLTTHQLQEFLVIFGADACPTLRANRDRLMKLPEFTRLVKEYVGDRTDPTATKCQFEEVEKLLRLVKCQRVGSQVRQLPY